MRMKKQFVAPRVVQEVQIQLEKDFLDGSVQNALELEGMGMEVGGNMDFSDGNTDGYTLDWFD